MLFQVGQSTMGSVRFIDVIALSPPRCFVYPIPLGIFASFSIFSRRSTSRFQYRPVKQCASRYRYRPVKQCARRYQYHPVRSVGVCVAVHMHAALLSSAIFFVSNSTSSTNGMSVFCIVILVCEYAVSSLVRAG